VTAQESADKDTKRVGGEAHSARLTNGLVNKEPARLLSGGCRVQRRVSGRVKLLASWAATCVLLFTPCVPVHGGLLGFRMWGINGTARVLIEYTKAVRNKGLLLERVDIKKDLYGFLYAPERNSRGVYNPFPNASAYHR
jgi:hypothetical protein